MQDARCKIQDARIQDARMQDAGCRMQDAWCGDTFLNSLSVKIFL
jgi:hypothetical protein